MQADQGEKERSFLIRAQSQAEVGLAASKYGHAPLSKLLRELSPILEEQQKLHSLGGDTCKRACFNICELHLTPPACVQEGTLGRRAGEESHCENVLHCTGHLRLTAGIRAGP